LASKAHITKNVAMRRSFTPTDTSSEAV